MTNFDWSARYLSVAILSIVGTVVVWVVNSALVLPIAFATATAFAMLALFHAWRLHNRPLV